MKNLLNSIIPCEYPKFLSKHLKNSRKNENSDTWYYNIEITECNIKKSLEFITVQIQGIIEQKPCDDIMIIKDTSGKFKLTNCENALRSKTPLVEGMYCAVTGLLIKERGLPEVSAIKLIPLGENEDDNIILYEYWSTEVEDYHLFMAGAIEPQFKFENT